MTSSVDFFNKSMLLRAAVFLLLLVLVVLAGLYLGKISVPEVPIAGPVKSSRILESAVGSERGRSPDEEVPSEQTDAVPLFLYVGGTGVDTWEIVRAQLALASEAGIRRYVVPLALDWSESTEKAAQPDGTAAILEKYLQVDAQAQLLLWVDLNPPVSWLEQHPDAAIVVNETLQAYPSISSPVWLDTAHRLLEQLILEVESGPYKAHILGYGLTALKDNRWILSSEFDESEANTAGFRHWLQRIYKSENGLREAWANSDIGFDTVVIPERPETESTQNALLQVPEQQPLVDFYRYCSEAVSGVLAGFASLTAGVSTLEPEILAPYGYTFEAMPASSGHFGLELLLESAYTGFVSPVSYFDRGLGGVGGMMAAVDSLKVRGKTWYLLDDTRTGVERDEDTGEFARIKGIRASDVYAVQQRNFSMAVTYGLGLIWSDPQGEGWLNDREQWMQFEKLKDIYVRQVSENAGKSAPESKATLTVVVDETSNFYLQDAEHTNSVLLERGRDAALRAGVSTRFHLLRDVIDGVAPPTPVYLFLNAFQLSPESRTRLHARFALEQACAIWLYAPGYFGTAPDTENIKATTGMDVGAFEEPTQTGSKYILSGHYMQAEQNFGTQELWTPLFYIRQGSEVDFLARYAADDNKGSIAVLTLPEGWTSLYIAEPELTPELLSELLQILEQHLYPNPVEGVYYDAVFAREPLVALHASRSGKRSLNLGGFYNIEDQLNPDIGWSQKDTIMLPMTTGETRLLRQQELPADGN